MYWQAAGLLVVYTPAAMPPAAMVPMFAITHSVVTHSRRHQCRQVRRGNGVASTAARPRQLVPGELNPMMFTASNRWKPRASNARLNRCCVPIHHAAVRHRLAGRHGGLPRTWPS